MRLAGIALLAVCMLICVETAQANQHNVNPLVKLEPLSQKVVINTEQMDLTRLLNVIRTNTESKIILAPEYAGVNDLKRKIALPKGMITLRELLDVICIQLEAKWLATGEDGDIVINPLQNTIVAESSRNEADEGLLSVEYAGKSLRRVLVDLHKKSGARIVMYGDVANIKIEIMMADASLEQILSHIADIYNLRLALTEDRTYRIGRED